MKRVIVIDDDTAIRDTIKLILEKAGFIPCIFANGNRVMEGNFEEPDIFFIDKQLSGIDGLDICRFLKQRSEHSQTPVIIFSASSRVEKAAREAGADDFLEKPFQSRRFVELIHQHIRNKETFST